MVPRSEKMGFCLLCVYRLVGGQNTKNRFPDADNTPKHTKNTFRTLRNTPRGSD